MPLIASGRGKVLEECAGGRVARCKSSPIWSRDVVPERPEPSAAPRIEDTRARPEALPTGSHVAVFTHGQFLQALRLLIHFPAHRERSVDRGHRPAGPFSACWIPRGVAAAVTSGQPFPCPVSGDGQIQNLAALRMFFNWLVTVRGPSIRSNAARRAFSCAIAR